MRMLVLLLRSGHTAKIALRENDLFAYVHDQQAGMDVASMADNDESRIISNNPGEES
jgi:hypothetical protein